jgi:peptidoglycan hydrolase-like protein with peptidoglycan-binding domain
MAASDMRRTFVLLALAALAPTAVLAQSAGEVERCFQNPAVCGQGGGQAGGGAAPAPSGGAPVATYRSAPAPDYTTVLQSPEPDRRHIQESLRTLDKYNGPIDGNLQSEATTKAISDWQKAHGLNPAGKLTPQEAQQLNAEAAKAPIKRIEPPPQTAAVPTPSTQANADALKAMQARLAERRKAAEPKAEAAAQSLIRDLKAYVAADGKGAVGDQFAGFAKWYADNKSAGRTVGEIAPVIDDYGDAKAGAAVTSEVLIESKKDTSSLPHCLVFAWIEGNPRKNAQTFSCDDVSGVEKWKTDQALRSAWR